MQGGAPGRTAADLAALIAGEVSAVEVADVHSTASRPRRRGRVPLPHDRHRPGRRRRGRRGAGPGRRPRPAGRRADGAEGHHLHPGSADHRRLADPGGLRPPYDGHRRGPAAAPAGWWSARPTSTSSPWAPPPRTPPTAHAQPVGHEPGAGRLLGRQRRGGGGRAGAVRARHRHRRPIRQPAALCGVVGLQAHLRPGVAATGSSPSPRRSTRSAPSPAPWPTRPCCSRPSPATTPPTPPRSRPPRCRRWPPGRRRRRPADRRGPASYRRRGHPARGAGGGRRRQDPVREGWAPRSRTCRCPPSTTACRPTT